MQKNTNLAFRKNQNLSQMLDYLDSIPFNKHRTNDTNIYRSNCHFNRWYYFEWYWYL